MEIKHRSTNDILYECDLPTIREAVEKAVKNNTDMRGAYLSCATLRGADMGGAHLRGAYLCGSDLNSANLRCADLSSVNLSCSNLSGADLRFANLSGAKLSCADLSGANLRFANLSGVYLDDEELLIAPISILNLKWDVLITHGYMTIGCQRHTHQEWAEFTEDEIKAMHPEAVDFWFGAWRIPLLNMCEAHRNEYEAAKAKGE